jgi:hypothetical protein
MQRSSGIWFGLMGGAFLAIAPSLVHAAFVDIGDCAALATASDERSLRLVGDVDCTAADDASLVLPDGGRLELQGFTLRGADVVCLGDCRVLGFGTIEGGGVIGDGRVVVRRVNVIGSRGDGVVASNHAGSGRVTLIDTTVADSAGNGVEFDRKATLVRSHVVRNGRHGIVVSQRATNDCSRGRIAAKVSSFRDNGRDGDCGTMEVCADVAACTVREAKLAYSTCDHSRQLGSGIPGRACGVCDFD